MKPNAAAFFAGLVFAVGLALGGMTQPVRVVGFLDIFGQWDPTLAFVMAGAVAVHFGGRLLVEKRERPLWQSRFVLPTRRDIDVRLLAGAVLFGVGWGLAGYCPGPALTSLGANATSAWIFVLAMAAGMGLLAAFERVQSCRARRNPT